MRFNVPFHISLRMRQSMRLNESAEKQVETKSKTN